MELTEEDKKFLEEVGKPLDEVASLVDGFAHWYKEECADEMVFMSEAILQEYCPILSALMSSNLPITKEVVIFRNQMALHIALHTWQATRRYDNS